MTVFEGVYPALITPMTPEGSLNEAALREVLEFDVRQGAHGFWVAGGTGESILLTEEENNLIAEIAADQVKGRAKCIMHVGANTTAQAARQAEHAARAGVPAICAVPPFFYAPSDESVVDYYRVVAAAADLPLFVYNLPQATGVEITPDMMKKLQDEVPQLAGLKHSSIDFVNVQMFAQMGLSCFTGNSYLMLAALTNGACGVVDGPPCAAPELWVEIFNAYRDGDIPRGEAAQRRASEFAGIVTQFGFHPAIKYAVGARLGIDVGNPRPPLPSITPEQRAQLRGQLERLGYLKEAVAQAGA